MLPHCLTMIPPSGSQSGRGGEGATNMILAKLTLATGVLILGGAGVVAFLQRDQPAMEMDTALAASPDPVRDPSGPVDLGPAMAPSEESSATTEPDAPARPVIKVNRGLP